MAERIKWVTGPDLIARGIVTRVSVEEPTPDPKACPMCGRTHTRRLVKNSGMNHLCWRRFVKATKRGGG